MLKKTLLISIIFSLSFSCFAIINFTPSVVRNTPINNPIHFKEHWALTAQYLQTIDAQPKLTGDFNVHTGRAGKNRNSESPKINSVVFGTEYTV